MASPRKRVRLAHLRIRQVDDGLRPIGLYNNNAHQFPIVIDVLKEVADDAGVWRHEPLTARERASVSVMALTAEDGSGLPPGWSCDTQKNKFTVGLYLPGQPLGKKKKTSEVFDNDGRVSSIKRYLRVDASASMDTVVFFAKVIIEGETLTTHHVGEGVASSISVTPSPAWQIPVAHLRVQVTRNVFNKDAVVIDRYVWIPTGLSTIFFVANHGFENPVKVFNEGDYFNTSFLHTVPGMPLQRIKGGTVVKALASPLYMNDIQKGFQLGEPNPVLPIDRAGMTAFKVSGVIASAAADTNSAWRVQDNFGTINIYHLYASGDTLKVRDQAEPEREIRLVSFEVKLAAGQDSMAAVFASGNSQCKVLIEVVAEVRLDGGSWQLGKLTESERASATLTAHSLDPLAKLPAGWFCDTDKNKYDIGVRHTLAPEVVDEHRHGHASTQLEVIDRFLRVNPGVIETQRFMACITLGGKTYTTNFAEGSKIFDSSITLRPVRAYALRIFDLVAHYDNAAYKDDSIKLLAMVTYWTPPVSIKLVETIGLSNPVAIANEGLHFQTATIGFDVIKIKTGGIVGKDQLGATLTMNDVHRGVYASQNPTIKFNERQTILRAVYFQYPGMPNTSSSPRNYLIYRDNYGREHRFRLSHTPYDPVRLTS
ncbi:hypothetical protein [Pseudomonas sp. Marseille-Q1929]|uniref:hypothetical protein n=1 Tax=Pseudomonas sp. Marseille-Q1929 TaxID=2730402 RepID=UPI001A8D3A86|nr:hypothetical protein [Pseudomonas sp. Marseille-Q1929]MBO0491833.1 hypothetical protein [Pseudomonas sp. Marseille-Q1929]